MAEASRRDRGHATGRPLAKVTHLAADRVGCARVAGQRIRDGRRLHRERPRGHADVRRTRDDRPHYYLPIAQATAETEPAERLSRGHSRPRAEPAHRLRATDPLVDDSGPGCSAPPPCWPCCSPPSGSTRSSPSGCTSASWSSASPRALGGQAWDLLRLVLARRLSLAVVGSAAAGWPRSGPAGSSRRCSFSPPGRSPRPAGPFPTTRSGSSFGSSGNTGSLQPAAGAGRRAGAPDHWDRRRGGIPRRRRGVPRSRRRSAQLPARPHRRPRLRRRPARGAR